MRLRFLFFGDREDEPVVRRCVADERVVPARVEEAGRAEEERVEDAERAAEEDLPAEDAVRRFEKYSVPFAASKGSSALRFGAGAVGLRTE